MGRSLPEFGGGQMILIISIAIIGFVYCGYIWVMALFEVKGSPRDAMFLCPKGHMIRTRDAINFMGQDCCPICFHNTLRDAEKSRG